MSLGFFYRRSLDVLPQSAHQGLYRRSPQDLAQTERRHDPLDTVARRATEIRHRRCDPQDLRHEVFLANPDMDRDLYQNQFHLNDTEIDLIASLVPKRQFLIKNHEIAKIANLEVDRKSYWLYTNDPFDNRKRAEASRSTDLRKAFEVLAGEPR